VIASGCRDDAGFRHLASEEIGKGAARLERSRVLEQLKLERQRLAGKAKLSAIDLGDRRSPDEGPNEPLALCNHFWSYWRVHCKALHGSLTRISHLAN
jgi:hypothetical protein